MKKIETFEDLNLRANLLSGFYSDGKKEMTELQKKLIMPIISSYPPVDVVSTSKIGTGKTVGFSLALLERIDLNHDLYSKGAPQALVIVPTREMAISLSHIIASFAKFMSVKVFGIYGGQMRSAELALQEIQHVVVGTPVKLLDLIESNILNVKYLKMLIVEEMSHVQNYGFQAHVEEIVKIAKKLNLQICIFGCARNRDTKLFIQKHLRDPILLEDL
ncbi:predicted protein [Naegleria gruberi]|uniref:ATP-dependent RNA helicase n=1 Tax=Naegleria gruberi TaxID=5762 RepID=D2VT22_NAEGR|nr:uncharacterized protein NAEGRDRAFT_72146 [Naegleria gruberi]EFC40071.1 predicted protein [Naegleria gruberi]|eukprot:XP_002672815.1 predicted protein [Naegleria gruberi strain NEG-M]